MSARKDDILNAKDLMLEVDEPGNTDLENEEELSDEDPRKAHLSYDLITYVEDRKGHDRRYAIAPDKIKDEIGWEPETMFKEGIRKTIKWYFEHQEWMEHITSGDYEKYYDSMYSRKLAD